jgi:uncharacterized protein YbbC (DUF1343 family)
MKFITILLTCLLISSSIKAQDRVYTGLEVAQEQNFSMLKGKRVGLITNATGVDFNLNSTVDILFNNKDVNLVALYGPEHGVRGDISAGEKVDTYVDEATGLTVYSLYGKTRKPTKEMMDLVDVLVYDIQDIGSRSYTFISTLGLAMEAAAEYNKEIVVLDRPNPLGGEKIEGNLVEDGYYSFVSQYNIPYVHGFTVGEFAKFVNSEKLLTNGVSCKLTVIPMKNWKRSMNFTETGLPWVPTSPHIPHSDSPIYYTASGVMGELGVISEGVGYTTPFQVYAAEWLNAQKVANKMNALQLPGVTFRPLSFKPYYTKHQGKQLKGVQIHIRDYKKVNLLELQFYFMQVHHELYPEIDIFAQAENRLGMFDKVMGSNKVRELFTKNYLVSDIHEFLNKDIESFRKQAQKYYLYQ